MFDTARDKAGLTPADLARYLNVHRITVSGWFNGHSTPHQLLRGKVDRLLDAVNRAVEDGDLPIPAGYRRAEREAYLNQILHKHLSAALKTAD